MKKIIAVALCLVLVLPMVGCGKASGDLNPDKWNADADSYESIEIFNGNSGETINISDGDSVSKVVDTILCKGYKKERKNKSDGFCYGVNFYGKDGNNQKITIVSENTIVYSDRYRYSLCLGSSIDLDYIDSLFDRGASEEHTLRGTITGINEQTMLVKGKDKNELYFVTIKNMLASLEPKVGYEVEIVYSGAILETYPASFNKVISVEVIGVNQESEADLIYEERIELYGDEGNDEIPDTEPIGK